MLKFRIPWSIRLIRARIRGKFTETDHALSEQWESCAVGEALGFPGMVAGAKPEDLGFSLTHYLPKEHKAFLDADAHGMEFMHAVRNDEPNEAIKHYLAIRRLHIPKWRPMVTNGRD